MTKPIIGFIGQGWIGKNYANNYLKRGFTVIPYSKEESYLQNKDRISECDIVFIAVPTPTTPEGFDDSIVREVVKLVAKGKIAVIKSTIMPGTTESIQKENPGVFVMHSPEFLTEVTAEADADHPKRNIIGIPIENPTYREKAELVMSTLPEAPFKTIIGSKEAEFIKYGNNCFFYTKIIFMNLFYDLTQKFGCDWEKIRNAMAAEPWIGNMHIDPVHKGGRGAGGDCFIKDFAAFRKLFDANVGEDELGSRILEDLEKKNIELLVSTNKNMNLLKEVYGERM